MHNEIKVTPGRVEFCGPLAADVVGCAVSVSKVQPVLWRRICARESGHVGFRFDSIVMNIGNWLPIYFYTRNSVGFVTFMATVQELPGEMKKATCFADNRYIKED